VRLADEWRSRARSPFFHQPAWQSFCAKSFAENIFDKRVTRSTGSEVVCKESASTVTSHRARGGTSSEPECEIDFDREARFDSCTPATRRRRESVGTVSR